VLYWHVSQLGQSRHCAPLLEVRVILVQRVSRVDAAQGTIDLEESCLTAVKLGSLLKLHAAVRSFNLCRVLELLTEVVQILREDSEEEKWRRQSIIWIVLIQIQVSYGTRRATFW